MPTAGYSGTPLWKKLGLKEGMTASVINPPPDYDRLLSGAPDCDWSDAGQGQHFTHLFTVSRPEMEERLPAVLATMARDGMIWVSWPKKASRIDTDITEDTIRTVCLPLGLVDVKVCAIDATWSALKLMIRRELR